MKPLLFSKPFHFIFFIQLLACSCKTSNFRPATLWIRVNTQDSFAQYTLKIPKKCDCSYYEGEDAREKIYTYSDSSYLFLADNLPIGLIPSDASKKYGANLPLKFTNVHNPILISGIDTSGRYWNIRRMGLVVYGYKNVSPKNKVKFDSVLNSMTKSSVNFMGKNNPEYYDLRGKFSGGVYNGKCKKY